VSSSGGVRRVRLSRKNCSGPDASLRRNSRSRPRQDSRSEFIGSSSWFFEGSSDSLCTKWFSGGRAPTSGVSATRLAVTPRGREGLELVCLRFWPTTRKNHYNCRFRAWAGAARTASSVARQFAPRTLSLYTRAWASRLFAAHSFSEAVPWSKGQPFRRLRGACTGAHRFRDALRRITS